MFSFFRAKPPAPEPPTAQAQPAPAQASQPHPLDASTGGIFSAASSAERLQRVQQWLATGPDKALLQQVYKELSARDQGAAKPIRNHMTEIRQNQTQQDIAQEWAEKADKIVHAATFRIADGMAWQRDAAKAGAPLSKEPLASLRAQIADTIKAIEELQHRSMVQKEAAVLLAQRIDVLSTKSWKQAADASGGLQADVEKWQGIATGLMANPHWKNVEPRYQSALESSGPQLKLVFDAFAAALAQAKAAAEDANAPLPNVQVWADELRNLHAPAAPKAAATPLTPEQQAAISQAIGQVEKAVRNGQAKESGQAAAALRETLKTLDASVDAELERRINRALIDAGDLQGWQRWGANQVREELIHRAEQLLVAEEGAAPVTGSKKLQQQLRDLREQWRQVDRSSPPNAHLWKRFDEAATRVHGVVETWLEKVKAETAAHKAERTRIIDELTAWGETQASAPQQDLKALQRGLQQYASQWRNAGHVSDKVFAQLQERWKAAYDKIAQPLEQARKQSIIVRRALIEEAQALAAAPNLDITAVKQLQQRWQAEAQNVSIERKQEQKLWDAFRKPLDEAFNRKDAQRAQAAAAMSAHDQAVMTAVAELEKATATGNAAAIRDAMQALEHISRHGAAVQTPPAAPPAEEKTEAQNLQQTSAGQNPATDTAAQAAESPETAEPTQAASTADVSPTEATDAADAADTATAVTQEASNTPAAAAPVAAPKPVIAMRGDDRPGQRPMAARPAERASGKSRTDARDARDGRGTHERKKPASRPGRDETVRPTAPRLSDKAFRAQRNALDQAQQALRKLASVAHGESLMQLLGAWQARDAAQMPSAAQLSKKLGNANWSQWQTAISQPAADNPGAATALLRLEIAADIPTPAHAVGERRALQLQLLTQKHAASPAETWMSDVTQILQTPADDDTSKRLQIALKALLKK